jgi:putative membrane protein insertion efficiency factor
MRGTERPGPWAVIAAVGVRSQATAVNQAPTGGPALRSATQLALRSATQPELRSGAPPAPGAAARAAGRAVRVYQRAFAGRLSPCRYWPTCSNYALEAFDAHGFWRGAWLTVRRLARCHPWGGRGFDPVPERGAR